jgi:hypothetical protein
MKLYQFFASPFPTRVRLMLYAKSIPFEIIEPPGFGNSTLPKGDYLKLNPLVGCQLSCSTMGARYPNPRSSASTWRRSSRLPR